MRTQKAERSDVHLQVLLENGAEIDAIDDLGETPLHTAAQFGHIELVEVRIESTLRP